MRYVCLVVSSIGLSLGIQDSSPVTGFVVDLVVDIDLNAKVSLHLLDGVGGDTNGGKGSSEQFSNSRWAPGSNDLTGLQGELGSEDRVLDGSIVVDLSERKGLVDRGALVTKGVNGSLLVDSNANGEATGNTRSGFSGAGKVLKRNAGNICHLRLEESHVEGRTALELLITKQY
jgi:hypothetical protein